MRFAVDGKVATLTLNRPDKKNPLTFESYAEIADIFRAAREGQAVKAFVITGEGGNFCSGGDVFEIIGPLVEMDTVGLLEFTRMTGEAVKAMRAVPAADRRGDRRRLRRRRRDPGDGVRPAARHREGQGRVPVQPRRPCRLRHGRLRDPAAHHRPGPRRGAALHRPRAWAARKPSAGASSTGSSAPESVLGEATKLARELADGPTFANAMTKRMLEMEWAMSVEQAIEAEAVAQALCMETRGFRARLPGLRREAEAGVRGQLNDRSPKRSPGRSSRTRHRAFAAASSRAGRTRRCPACRMTTSTRPAARASRRWARPASSRPSVPAEHGGLHPTSSTCARSASRARSWRSATGSPTSPSRCRGSAPARSRSTARRS